MAAGQLTFTDLGSGGLRISAGSCLLRSADDETLKLVEYQLAQQDVDIPEDTERYVGVQYNSGSPNFVVKTTDTWNDNSDFRVAAIYNEADTLHVYPRLQRSHNVQRWLTHRMQEVEGLRRADYLGGLILGDSGDGNRYVTLSAGELYVALEEFDIDAVDTSGADTFDSYYRKVSDSGWNKVAAQSAWNNDEYDDNSGSLATLSTAAKYAVNWFYLETDGAVVHVYGQGEYSTLTLALAETPPASLPGRLEVHGVLLGAVIFQRDDTTAQVVKTAFTETFGSASVTAHNTLSGLSADDHTQYAILAGRDTPAPGQTLYGGTAATRQLTLQGTSHATDGNVVLNANQAGTNYFLVGPSSNKVGQFTKASGDNFVYVSTDNASGCGVYFYNTIGGWYINTEANGKLDFYDVINSKLVMQIQKGCPDNSLVLEQPLGSVGMGTVSPATALHVLAGAGQVRVQSTTTSTNAALQLIGRTSTPGDQQVNVQVAVDNAFSFYDVTSSKTLASWDLRYVANNAILFGNNASEILTLTSTTQAFIPPKMTTTQMNAIATPVNGMLIFNTTAQAHYAYKSNAWAAV